jgi:YebC/PmpR family DNA-binding regulatory protein
MGRHGTIAGRKAAQDAKRGALFTKYANGIIQAAKVGGGDPANNASLRSAIDKAKSINMPGDKIKNAIKRGTGELQGDVLTSTTFEGYGPSGVAVIVETLTDNPNRTTSAVKNIFSKNGGNMGTPGCVAYMFQRKGVILIAKTEDISEEELMDVALENGADDFNDDGEFYEVLTAPEAFGEVSDAIKAAGYEIEQDGIELVADNFVDIADENVQKQIDRMLDSFDENDDIQNVFTNIK